MMMEINNRFKPIMELVNLLAPNYKFSPRTCIGCSNITHYMDIHWVPELSSEYYTYVGSLCLESMHIKSIKPTEIILFIPYQNIIAKNLLKDWRKIGIHFKEFRSNSKEVFYHYYSIEINDTEIEDL